MDGVILECKSLVHNTKSPKVIESHVMVYLTSKFWTLCFENFAIEAPFLGCD